MTQPARTSAGLQQLREPSLRTVPQSAGAAKRSNPYTDSTYFDPGRPRRPLRRRDDPGTAAGSASRRGVEPRVRTDRQQLTRLRRRLHAYKPHREPHLHAARTLGLPSAALVLVATLSWDVVGARADLSLVWSDRLERTGRSRRTCALGEYPRRGGRARSRQTGLEVE
jgi:hypothetical protein